MNFTHALVRPPSSRFAEGLTQSAEGAPDVSIALEQHHAYCRALEDCGLEINELPADPRYPDSCFVEDAAVVLEHGAIALRPGAPSRAGEVESVTAALRNYYPQIARVFAPATVDGGDICQIENHFLIGISSRTNEQGARQLARLLSDLQCTSSIVDIRGSKTLLHLKSGLAYLGSDCVAVTAELARDPALSRYEKIPVRVDEGYAANCIRVNDYVLAAAGYPKFTEQLAARQFHVKLVEMSEFRKMDGGLSCLSLRF